MLDPCMTRLVPEDVCRTRPAFFSRKCSLSYAQLAGMVSHYKAQFCRDGGSGKVILLYLSDQFLLLAALLAAVQVCKQVAVLHPTMTIEELAAASTLLEPDGIVIEPQTAAKLRSHPGLASTGLVLAECLSVPGLQQPDGFTCQKEAKVILFSSGTTNNPKGLQLSIMNLIDNARLLSRILGLNSTARGTFIGPLSMGMNLIFCLAHLCAGAAVYLNSSFYSPNAALQEWGEAGITGISTVPAIINVLMQRCDLSAGLKTLQYIRIGAGEFSAEKLKTLRGQLPGVRIYKTYGLTEIGLVSVLCDGDGEARFGSVGKAVPSVVVNILDAAGRKTAAGEQGEIVILAEHGIEGIYSNGQYSPRTSREIQTGDIGYFDSAGFLYLCGRLKNILKIAGETVYPEMIEEKINAFPGVKESVVIGLKDAILGEIPCLFVVPREEHVIEIIELKRLCSKVLPPHLMPARIEVVPSVPRVATGKINRRKLKEMYELSRK